MIDDNELYLPIKDIKPGMLVKTYLHGYKKVIIKGKSELVNGPFDSIYKLYKMSKYTNSQLIEDLYITGIHSILVDELSEEQKLKISKYWKTFLQIDDKYLLMACVCDDFEQTNDYEICDVYQLVLEHKKSNGRYGIWANGILSETMSLNTFNTKNRFSSVEKI